MHECLILLSVGYVGHFLGTAIAETLTYPLAMLTTVAMTTPLASVYAMREFLANVYREEGIAGLYKGTPHRYTIHTKYTTQLLTTWSLGFGWHLGFLAIKCAIPWVKKYLVKYACNRVISERSGTSLFPSLSILAFPSSSLLSCPTQS